MKEEYTAIFEKYTHTRKSHTAQRYVTPRLLVNEIQVQHIGLNLNRHYRGRLVEHDRRQSVYRRHDTAVLG